MLGYILVSTEIIADESKQDRGTLVDLKVAIKVAGKAW
jgi:hypothetical protein